MAANNTVYTGISPGSGLYAMAEMNAIEHNIELQLLGSLSLTIGGRPLPPLRTKKGQWLLTLLVLRDGRPVDRGWLAGMLWPDSLEEQSLCNLRRALTDLRSALGGAADRISAPTPRSLAIDLRVEDTVDLYRFKQLIEMRETSSLEQAVALYRGSLLEGCDEHWVFQERLTIEHAYLSAMERLATSYHDENRFEDAVSLLQKVILLDPLRESARRRLISTYAASGNLSSAILAYREFRELVRHELNSTPDTETTELYEKIRASVSQIPRVIQDQPDRKSRSLAANAGRLPRPLSDLIGRTQESLSIDAALSANRLVTLLGTGGIGKTRLAIQAAETALYQFPDGAWFADLSGIKLPDRLASFVATSLDIREDAAESPREQLTQFLKHKELLLILDNCEHIISACAELADLLLDSCARLKILATSREPLGINGEHRWSVPALSTPAEDRVPSATSEPVELLKYDSIRLFAERGRGLQPEFALNAQNMGAVVEICNRLDGIPLSIELAAARLSVLTPEQIAARLKDRFRLLTGGSRTAWPRHQTLIAMIEWSHELLSDAERMLFRRLAVFNGGWTIDDLQCTAFVESDLTDQLDVFASLLDKSLVQADAEVDGERRYRMLETIREFALDKLKSAGEWNSACRKHALFFVSVAEVGNAGILTQDREFCIRRLLGEHDNLRSALEWAICTRGEAETAARIATSLSRFWYSQCLYREGLRWLEQVIEIDEQLEPAILCKLYNGLGSMYWVTGQFDSAQAYYERNLAISREQGDALGLGYALMNLGLVAMHRGEYVLARSRMEESIALLRKHGERTILATPINNLAIVVKDMGELDYASALLEESYALNAELNNRRGMASTLVLRGNLQRRLGNNDAARTSLHEARALAIEIGDRQCSAIALHNLGDLSLHDGDLAAARACYDECLTISAELSDRRQTATTLCSMGQLNREEGNLDKYRVLYRQSADLALEMKDRVLMFTLLTDLANQAEVSGDLLTIPRLAGVIEAAFDQFGTPLSDIQKADLQRITTIARRQLGDETYCAAFAEGQSTPLDLALNNALDA